MPYHIIGIYWNEWLDIHEVLWWLPYFAQKEKKKAITAITCYYPAGLQSFPSQSPSLPNTNREYCSPGFNPKMQDEGRFVAPSASLLVERFECETVYACAQRSNDWHGSIPFVPFPAKMAWCGGKIVTQSTGNTVPYYDRLYSICSCYHHSPPSWLPCEFDSASHASGDVLPCFPIYAALAKT